jgi:hypothetical protein
VTLAHGPLAQGMLHSWAERSALATRQAPMARPLRLPRVQRMALPPHSLAARVHSVHPKI